MFAGLCAAGRLPIIVSSMKLDSDLFDRIRVKPSEDRRLKRDLPPCESGGCDKPGGYRAPKGRGREGEYYCFCLDHVREYNQSYNYFAGMDQADMDAYIKSSSIGHRPTWRMGVRNPTRRAAERPGFADVHFDDAFDMFDRGGPAPPREERLVRNVERSSFATLNLDATATASEIKARFKELVKRHHPDVNGGDKNSEEKLRDVIQAYNHLKAAGFC